MDKICAFCCDVHPIDIHTYKNKDSGIERYVFIDKDFLAIELYEDIAGLSAIIRENICYCPMCGRKLGG